MAKRAKRSVVTIEKVPTTHTYTRYICPHCYVEFVGGTGISDNTTRFLCRGCGNEIIAEIRIIDKTKLK